MSADHGTTSSVSGWINAPGPPKPAEALIAAEFGGTQYTAAVLRFGKPAAPVRVIPLFTKHGRFLNWHVSAGWQNEQAGGAQSVAFVHALYVVTEQEPSLGPDVQIPSLSESRSIGSSRQSAG